MPNKLSLLAFLLIASPALSFSQPRPPFLSSLSATKDAPLYTTYAAPMERSEFTLDKGYHFVFYDSTRGADFTNAAGGDICLGFKMGSKYVYALRDMARQPVITASFADMVQYTFYPFDSIRVNVTFLVHSSHSAVQVIDVRNLASSVSRIQVLPFLRNSARTFDSVAFRKDAGAMTFTHEEFPDDWVLEHKIPYVNKVRDAYALSDPPDRMMSFRSERWGSISIPQEFNLERPPGYLVWGRLEKKGGGRCSESGSRLMALLNGDRRRIHHRVRPPLGKRRNQHYRLRLLRA